MNITMHNLKMFSEECERQHVGPKKVYHLAMAWQFLASAVDNDFVGLLIIAGLGRLIEEEDNPPYGWRQTEVTIEGAEYGEDPAPAREVPDRMERWWDMIDDMTTDEAVRELLIIHPWTDGNGRAAFLVQNWLNGTLHECEPLVDHFG